MCVNSIGTTIVRHYAGVNGLEYKYIPAIGIRVVQGHYISTPRWTPISEILMKIAEDGSHHDQIALALHIPDIGNVGDAPHELSCSW